MTRQFRNKIQEPAPVLDLVAPHEAKSPWYEAVESTGEHAPYAPTAVWIESKYKEPSSGAKHPFCFSNHLVRMDA